MTFITFTLGLLTFLGLTSCNPNSNKQTAEQTNSILLADKEIFSLYKKTDSIIYVARALTTGNDKFDLHLYELNISTPEGAKQTFDLVQQLTQQELDNKKTELQSKYNWTPFKGNEVLFVQIRPTGFKDEMELLDKRQEIEDKLSKALENKKLGEWFAGDLGPGGGNMLYTVTDIDKSLQIILEILQQNKLDKNVLIGRRVMVDKGDWFYEVIYPTKYSGDFNTM
ncbi:hypothetical protein [Algoriphagus antarcticus]|uniref:Uncharacterized protein n=1 Tax=Algoriphagus antarcticus TaxID=238540 RepID=A0A3E0D2F5_9BACT|nr:hypothetical protein [Algoriphagus antarcticus]REG76880.1 hypothetical protein C8N25_1562 [Algoriphagus antarcticus]